MDLGKSGFRAKQISFIQGQTLIDAKAPHGGYPWWVDLGLILDWFMKIWSYQGKI